MSERIPAAQILEALKQSFRERRAAAGDGGPKSGSPLGWVVAVPDTQQRTLLALLAGDPDLRLLPCATEDEANAIAAGLHIGGELAVLSIQHTGLYASVNTLRGVAIDGEMPIFCIVGLFGREPDLDLHESRSSMVRYCEPLLDTFGVPHARLEGPDDLPRIAEYHRLAYERRGPAVVLIGRETA